MPRGLDGLTLLVSSLAILGAALLSACAAGAITVTPIVTPLATSPSTRVSPPTATPTATPRPAVAARAVAPTATPSRAVAGGDPQQGKQAIEKYGCGACHIIPGVPGANGKSGPSLVDFASSPDIAGAVPNTPQNLILWIQNPRQLKAGTLMPALGVDEADARNIAAYLYTLKQQ